MAQLTAYEQYLLELINRDRADPEAAATLYGIGLNDDIEDPDDYITDVAKQPLAFNFLINDAANFHSQWMINNNTFAHAGENGDRANDRMSDAGYPFIGGEIWAENLSKASSSGTINLTAGIIRQINQGLFTSASHRQNTMGDIFREVGLAIVQGDFNGDDSLLVTENFGKSGSDIFLTGVAFDDLVEDDSFYSVGEGLANIEVTAVRQSDNLAFTTTTTSSGGYNLILEPGTYKVNFQQNNQTIGSDRRIKIVDENIKLDLDTSNLSQSIGEIGRIDNFDHHSQTIQLENDYVNPVVFALPLSHNGGAPAIARITDIQSDEFSLYLQEAEYLDGVHADESLSYLVLEAGTWELDNGAILEVGTIDTSATVTETWAGIDFQSDFASKPATISQVQTKNGGQFVRTRQNAENADGFELAMEEEEALKNSGHAQETIGWLAIETGISSWDGMDYRAGHTGTRIDHTWDQVNFAQTFDDSPNLFAAIATYEGADPVGLRYHNLGTSSVQIELEEDQSLDTEIGHAKESVDFLAIAGTGSLSAVPYDPMVVF